MKVGFGGGTPVKLATGSAAAIFDIAVDQRYVYWTASDGVEGSVLRAEKK